MSLKHEELANPDSCLNRAADDEPVFVLRANDPLAGHVVRYWSACYAADKQATNPTRLLTPAQVAKVEEARLLAARMDAWQRSKGK